MFDVAAGSAAEKGYFGPWRQCKLLLYGRERCGQGVSRFQPVCKFTWNITKFGAVLRKLGWKFLLAMKWRELIIGDVKWKSRLTVFFSAFCTVAVWVAGLAAATASALLAVLVGLAVLQLAMASSAKRVLISYSTALIGKVALATLASEYFYKNILVYNNIIPCLNILRQ